MTKRSVQLNNDNVDAVIQGAIDALKKNTRRGPYEIWIERGPARDELIKELKSSGYVVKDSTDNKIIL